MPDPLPADMLQRILLRQPTRREVYEAIRADPGAHVRGLARTLGKALGTIEHHVRQLERHDMVFAHAAGRRRTLYASADIDARDVAMLHAVSKPAWARILQALLDDPEVSITQLAGRLGLARTSLTHHMRRLREQGLVEAHQVGRERIHLIVDPGRVRRLLGPTPLVGLVARAADATKIDHIAALH